MLVCFIIILHKLLYVITKPVFIGYSLTMSSATPEETIQLQMSNFNIFESDFGECIGSFFDALQKNPKIKQVDASINSGGYNRHDARCPTIDFDILTTNSSCWWKSMLVWSRV